MSKKIQVGPGTGGRKKNKKNAYGGRSNGVKNMNGGFNGQPTVNFQKISEEQFTQIFGVESLPRWKRELLEKGESID